MKGSAQPSQPPVTPSRITREGEVRSTTVPTLFHEMQATRATGLLTLTDGPARKTIQFKNGTVLFASSNQRDDRLNQFLLTAGIIGLKDLMKSLEVMVATKDRLGEVLIRYKMLTPEQV